MQKMGGSTQIGRVFGIPIKVHITLWILLPLIGLHFATALGTRSLLWGLLAAAGLFASVALHELGHSVVALAKGCRVREILLLPIGGMAQMDRMPSRPRDELQIAVAGPLVSFVLALAGGLLGGFATTLGWRALGTTLMVLGGINLMLALFNLLPSFPMDGGRVFRAWMTPRLGRLEATRRAAKVGRIMAVIFGVFGLFNGNLILVAIAIFIYMAAGAEYRTVRIQEAMNQHQFGPWAPLAQSWPDEREVLVGPAPYEKGHASSIFARPVRMQHDLFEELFRDWKW
ncbi:MAG: site-2 protease family protein [Kiritimatiellae bacterium]|nr:site-2 protease family protein [Kiritimatiellia bacterium]